MGRWSHCCICLASFSPFIPYLPPNLSCCCSISPLSDPTHRCRPYNTSFRSGGKVCGGHIRSRNLSPPPRWSLCGGVTNTWAWGHGITLADGGLKGTTAAPRGRISDPSFNPACSVLHLLSIRSPQNPHFLLNPPEITTKKKKERKKQFTVFLAICSFYPLVAVLL